MKMKKVVALSTVIGVAIAGIAFISPASAEPVSNSYVLVGSDTLQDSSNALLNGTGVTASTVRVVTSGAATIGSFDAFGSAVIQTKTGGPFFTRPSGSGAGVTALRASITGNLLSGVNISDQVDIARSSSGPGTSADAAGKLVYVPYARDAVSYAYKGGTAAWANITAAQLTQIYNGTLTTIDGVAVRPRLPQTASGTRKFFLTAIGVGGGTSAPAVSDVGNVTPENDATQLVAGDIIPFSAANWVAQANGVTAVNTTTSATAALGTPITGTVPFTGSAPSLVPNSAFYSDTTFGRDTYLVVEYNRVDSTNPAYDAVLAALVNPTGSGATSLTSFGSGAATSGAVKKKFGFLAPSTNVAQRAYATL
jgi:ABC-type phosphate transport system substrate-binding protein